MLRNKQLAKLKENIRKCEDYKRKIASAVALLNLQLAASLITKNEHETKLARILEGKSLDYWNEYYDSLIDKYDSKISSISKRMKYSLSIFSLLAMAMIAIISLGQFTGQATYTGIAQHGYIDRGGNCNYGTTGLTVDTGTDDSVYFGQGPFNGAYTSMDWQTNNDIIYIDIGPITESKSDIEQINVTWNGRFSKTPGTGKPPSNVGISWYDWTTGSWVQFDAGIVSQAEKTTTLTITDLAIIQAIVSAETSGYVRLGFQAIGTNTQCNSLVLTDLSASAVSVRARPTTITTSVSTTSSTTSTVIGSTTTTSSTSSTTTSLTTVTTSTSLTTTTSTTSTVLPSPPAQVLVTVAATVGITVDAAYSTADFSTLVIDSTDDTLDNVPLPILIRNEGSVLADVQIEATELWQSLNRLPSDYRFSISVPDPLVLTLAETSQPADSCSPLQCFDASGTILAATPMPITPSIPANAIDDLDFADGNDEAEIDIYIHVPNDEPAGTKSSTLTITGIDASTF